MNKQEEHRDDEQLLRLADGELDPKQAAQGQAHLKACWHCRTRLEDLQSTIAGYVRYRESVLAPLLPPPPQPWGSLRGGLRSVDAEMAPPRRSWNLFASPRWLATAAAALLIGVVAYRMQHEPVVSAAELLRKASAAEPGPSPRGRIRIKTRTRTLLRARSLALRPAAVTDMPELQALFLAANFSWEDPLSAHSFEAWRAQLQDRTDAVGIRGDRYAIRTTTRTNKLTEAELTLRGIDLRPISETLQFEGGERVEIAEAPDEPPSASVAASRPVSTPTPAEPPASVIATAGDELRVIAALHQIGADLGEPIEITRIDGKDILVAGTGLDAGREEQIRALLANQPRVRVRFAEPQQASPVDGVSHRPDSRTAGAPVSMLQLQLQSYLGGAAALQKFTDGILEASEGAMARAHGLRNLAERFPPSEEQKMAPAERSLLTTLRRDHERALKGLAHRMVQLLQPVVPVPAQSGSVIQHAGAWQDNARTLLDSARQVDNLLNQMLAGGDGNEAQKHTPHELAAALSSLQAQLAADEMP
jgi:hypothetical protein